MRRPAFSPDYTVVCRMTDGTVHCWGHGVDGEVGDGMTGSITQPDQVAPP